MAPPVPPPSALGAWADRLQLRHTQVRAREARPEDRTVLLHSTTATTTLSQLPIRNAALTTRLRLQRAGPAWRPRREWGRGGVEWAHCR
jgi:hypothetical protein